MNIAIFPGTFDPITLGHYDLIKRACKLFEHVIVAVASSPSKHTMFPLQERVRLIQECCTDLPQVKAIGFSGMLPDFIIEQNANVIIRGVRSMTDYDYEMQLTNMYRLTLPQVEIVMLPSNGNLTFISSSIVREIIIHHGDVKPFVPANVMLAIEQIYAQKAATTSTATTNNTFSSQSI